MKYITFSLSETFCSVYFPLPLALQGRHFPIPNPNHCHCFAGRPHKANMPKLWPSKFIINPAAKQLIWWRPLQSSIHYTQAYVGMRGFYIEHGLLQIRKRFSDEEEFWQNETGGASWSLLLTKYDSDDRIKKNDMNGLCGTYGGQGRCRQGFGGAPEGKKPLGRPRYRWEDNMKMYLQEGGWGHGLDRAGSG